MPIVPCERNLISPLTRSGWSQMWDLLTGHSLTRQRSQLDSGQGGRRQNQGQDTTINEKNIHYYILANNI